MGQYLRKVIGWAMSQLVIAGLVGDDLRIDLWSRKMPKGVILNRDCSSQYCAILYQSQLTRHDSRHSMSSKGSYLQRWRSAIRV